ncbi:angiotensin-converting enzyme-related protein [Glossina fuscipes]|uniref:Angiotensin-converting enzyme n=1 Tax=Glossina fuscipes TaxID=7396 RepID=A0A9C5Z4H9_9MUSC|nr:angiotensin-converting enzyme-related protein [Glossina fuscipes]
MTATTLLIIVLCMARLAISQQAAKSTPAPTSRAVDKYAHTGIYETHAKEALLVAAKRMQHVYNRKREIFHSLTQGRGYNLMQQGPIKQEIDNDYHSLVHELALNLSVIPVQQLKNATLRRQVQRLSKLQLYGLDKADLEQAKEMLHTMQSFQTSRLICVDDCTQMIAMIPTIKTQVIRTKNLKDLEYYWLKWRQVIGENDLAKSTFIDFVRYLRIAATYNGHVTPSRTWYLYYDSENFQRELEDIVWEMMPLYKELHAYLRYSIRLTYGQQLTESDGGIPAPVFEQIISQSWYPRPAFRTPYPKSQLPTVKQRLEEVMVTPVKINKKVAEFFESLGLNHMSDAFYEKFSRRINDDEIGPNCEAEVFYFPPDVALRYCPKLDYKILLQMHGHMAELQYNLYKKELPFGLDREPCPGFGSAIGEAAIISSGTPRHLHRLHILLNSTLSIEHSMNRLFRMAVHTLLAVPQYFINDKFLVDVMDGRIGSHEFNCGYWRLQSKYAGVVPPMRRNEKNFDPDFKFYRGLNPEKSNTAKFISEVLGFEFYRAFCLASGEYKPGNPDFPLSNCDFYGSKSAGNMIKKMMQLGAAKHWRDVMEIATSERKLSAKGLMEYFGPLFIWLKEENKRLDIQTGWDDDIECGNN